MSFRVGQKVVCIASPERIAQRMKENPGANYPASNGIYTVREMRDDAPYRNGNSNIVMLLVEIDNSHLIGTSGPYYTYAHVEPGFSPEGFRPLVYRPTSIAIFRQMLTNDEQRNRRELERLNEERGAPMELPLQ